MYIYICVRVYISYIQIYVYVYIYICIHIYIIRFFYSLLLPFQALFRELVALLTHLLAEAAAASY